MVYAQRHGKIKIMINAIRSIALLSVVFAASICAQRPTGQIVQMSPELCGKPDASIPVPANISASFDISDGTAQLLFLRNNAVEKRLDLPGVVDQIDEVCPISNQRLLIFSSNTVGATLFIIDLTKSALIDSFWCFKPALSPNQRWLVYRKFYPRHTQFPPSEEYLLYDLERSPEQNRQAGISLEDYMYVGQAIFPKKKLIDAPSEHTAQTGDRVHEEAGAFFWTQDSHLLIFGDSLQRHFSVVAVIIGESGQTEIKLHGVEVKDVCPPTTSPDDFAVSIASADAEATNGGDFLIKLSFTPNPGVCDPKPLQFSLSDFHDAPIETFVKPKRKKAVLTQ